jgi:hypothetical protein
MTNQLNIQGMFNPNPIPFYLYQEQQHGYMSDKETTVNVTQKRQLQE